ncbi:hypothetical protein AVEN_107453-1 [Araneus ventricosus]|uniref:Uncharacterized protein n=1 Tax=Araneus ventricosus TaxID=182803 RepID=A0A4Y2G805_ARAVE|nr:hypothetical protein AVEN_107453-1 [Araneus ventricosus]
MESRFPAMRVLRLGREFYRGKYEMTYSSHVSISGVKNWRRNMGSQRCWNLLDICINRGDTLECTRRFYVTSRPAEGDYIRRALGGRRGCWSTVIALERGRLWSSIGCAS